MPTLAQEATPAAPLITQVRFVGNERFDTETLGLLVQTRANRRLLGIPGLTWWRWIYDLGERGTLGERFSNVLRSSGEAPALLDPSVLAADVERLRIFYQQEGFRAAEVTARTEATRRPDRVRVIFTITPGPATFIRHVTYDGLAGLSRAQQQRLLNDARLRYARPDPAQPLRRNARNQRYSEPTLLEERQRLLGVLRDLGYADVTRDSIRAIITPRRADSFDVLLRIRPGPRYRFGGMVFAVEGPEPRARPRADTLWRISPLGDSLRLTMSFQEESQVAPGLLTRSLQFDVGDWYSQADLLATKRRLEATGVFAFTAITPLLPNRAGGGVRYLPHRFELRTRPRHQMQFETFMLQRRGVLGESGVELGTGVAVTYQNLNLLGGGEVFQVRTSGSVAVSESFAQLTSVQAEVAFSLTYPYLTWPFRRLERRLRLYDARTRFSTTLLTARRDDLFLVIRGRGRLGYQLELRHTPTLTSFVDLLDVSLSNPDTLSGFRETFLDQVLTNIDDPVQQGQILEDYTDPQINNALRYTLRAANVNPLRRDRGYSYEAAAEVGGNLPYLLDRFLFSPDSLEGSLPGLPFFRGDRTNNRLVYRQYVRFVTDLRRYRPVGERTVVAWKFIGGFAHPTGKAELVPFDRRFFTGGAFGVRGWRFGQLGPGEAQVAGANQANILGGDIRLEASAELRHLMLREFLAANWIGALFLDLGNVWFGPRNPGFGTQPAGEPDGRFRVAAFYRELGAGAGLGLRLDWEYLIARLDIAFKAYDPARPTQGFLPDGLRTPLVHFSIGHAF